MASECGAHDCPYGYKTRVRRTKLRLVTDFHRLGQVGSNSVDKARAAPSASLHSRLELRHPQAQCCGAGMFVPRSRKLDQRVRGECLERSREILRSLLPPIPDCVLDEARVGECRSYTREASVLSAVVLLNLTEPLGRAKCSQTHDLAGRKKYRRRPRVLQQTKAIRY